MPELSNRVQTFTDSVILKKKKYGGIYSECYLLYYFFEETKENSVRFIIAKYAYHWYNKL